MLADFAAKKKLFYFVELCWVFNFLGWGILFLEIGEFLRGAKRRSLKNVSVLFLNRLH